MKFAEMMYKEAKFRIKGKHAMLTAAFMVKAMFTLAVVMLAACAAVCFEGAFDGEPDIIPAVLFIILAIIAAAVSFPARLGYKRMTVMLSNGDDVNMNDLFYYYGDNSRFSGSVKVYLVLALRMICLAVIAGSSAVVFYFAYMLITGDAAYAFTFSVALLYAAVFVCANFAVRYVYVTYLAVLNNCRNVNKCIKASVMLRKTYRGRLLSITAACTLPILTSLLVFPALYGLPLVSSVFAVSARHTVNDVALKSRGEPI